MEHKFVFAVCEITINDRMRAFGVKKYCQNINGIKVTKHVQLVYTAVSKCKVGLFLRNKKT